MATRLPEDPAVSQGPADGACPCSLCLLSGLIGIDTRYHNDFVSNLLLNPCQSVNVFHNRFSSLSAEHGP